MQQPICAPYKTYPIQPFVVHVWDSTPFPWICLGWAFLNLASVLLYNLKYNYFICVNVLLQFKKTEVWT